MRRTLAPLALTAAALLLAAPAPRAQSFSAPTEITNAYAPFVVESVSVFAGRSQGARTTTIVRHLPEPRTFSWGTLEVTCCVREERAFADGELVEIATSYLAQDDDGNVHLFGEVSLLIEEGEPADVEDDSWIVGPPLPSDPAGVQSAEGPALCVPATLVEGQVFQQDPSGQEQLTVLAVDRKLRVKAGRYTTAVKLQEANPIEGGGKETTWIVPGIGIVKENDVDGRSQLVATSLAEQLPDQE